MSEVIVLGRLTSPFAIKGWFKLHPFGDDPESWQAMPQWWVSPESGAPLDAWQQLTLEALTPHGKGWIVKFQGISDRTAAEAYRGWYVGAPRSALPEPEADEFYWGDLVGCRVETPKGEVLGVVIELISAGAHDVLVVRNDKKTHLIPFVRAYVPTVDLNERRIVADWSPEW